MGFYFFKSEKDSTDDTGNEWAREMGKGVGNDPRPESNHGLWVYNIAAFIQLRHSFLGVFLFRAQSISMKTDVSGAYTINVY